MMGLMATCEIKSPVTRFAQGIKTFFTFQKNCGQFNISYPTDGKFSVYKFLSQQDNHTHAYYFINHVKVQFL